MTKILTDELGLARETSDGATVESLRQTVMDQQAIIAELRAKYEPEEGVP